MFKGFKYIANESSNILILGTFPGEESRKLGQYYGNKRNQFWKILFEIYNEEYNKDLNYEEKINFLLRRNIALWDVIETCITEGSLDSKIKDPTFNNINKFLNSHEKITKIFCNGMASYNYLKRQKIDFNNIVVLPSSSPTNTMKYDIKFKTWKEEILGIL